MSAEQLTAIAGLVLALGLGYLPWVADWYDALESRTKVTVMGVLLVLVALGTLALSCAGIYPLLACTKQGIGDLFITLVTALAIGIGANQGTYSLFIKPFKKPSPNLRVIQEQYGPGQAPGYPKK